MRQRRRVAARIREAGRRLAARLSRSLRREARPEADRLGRRIAQYAFQDTLNLNPIAYLRVVCLSHVHREFRLGDSVTSAAPKWGFRHQSSFARDYRAMFGELPSAIAKRHARHAT
ncbi:helix-turn-helix domain-containing protein [Burkholderia cepacia]|uniref:helix-turn-helix domain-containing protein n=1 Tax=Burkholderia cepacia TaxID=292 RepID=UPI0022AA8B3D|nr:helix-turn-helix domain-containing protein [Burkholderia cepacia]